MTAAGMLQVSPAPSGTGFLVFLNLALCKSLLGKQQIMFRRREFVFMLC